MRLNKKEFHIESFINKGLTREEAEQYWEFHQRANWNGTDRAWRNYATTDEKDYKMEAEYREKYSPLVKQVTETIHEHVARKNAEKEQNLTIF